MSPPNYQEYSSGCTGFLLAIVPAVIMYAGLRFLKPDYAVPMMTISGGILSVIILVLYPILLFNKSFSKLADKT